MLTLLLLLLFIVECSDLKEEMKSLRHQLEHTQREKDRLSLSLSDKTKVCQTFNSHPLTPLIN